MELFWNSPEEKLAPTIWDSGDTTISNEARLELFKSVAMNIGGGYLGVGSTQNFLLAAWADSKWIWLIDFTRIVVAANKIHVAFIKESETPSDLLKLWKTRSAKQARIVIRKHLSREKDLQFIMRTYRLTRRYVNRRFKLVLRFAFNRKYKIWLNNQGYYDRIRNLALKGHIRALAGDLNGKISMSGIGEAAKKMKIEIRILYTSNAEEYKVFFPYSSQFRKNIMLLPTDSKSVVLRTISASRRSFPWAAGWKGISRVGFHYNEQLISEFKGRLISDKRINILSMLKTEKIELKNGHSRTY